MSPSPLHYARAGHKLRYVQSLDFGTLDLLLVPAVRSTLGVATSFQVKAPTRGFVSKLQVAFARVPINVRNVLA
jgi:hypothetical protein